MVRLKESRIVKTAVAFALFQFLNGTIKRLIVILIVFVVFIKFQFLNGTIKRTK